MAKQRKSNVFNSKEDVVSMFLGLVVVVAVVGFLVNFIEKRKGNVDLPGVSNDLNISEVKDDSIKIDDNEKTVVVEKNDSLWKIAVKEYGDGYKWTGIAKANDISNPSLIFEGQKLTLPVLETSVDGKGEIIAEKTEYKVVSGDNLWKIAVKYYGDGYQWTKIWQDNREKLYNPDMLEIGMTLTIYGKI
ncbi:MAG TPA: LysM peptidoglycan-binding domain-containing protein [Candidatus Methanoperedens sp.]|nr:LysM peptidoglycan-binding domain-containing protein [Candidatus Methanoperedens sp.]